MTLVHISLFYKEDIDLKDNRLDNKLILGRGHCVTLHSPIRSRPTTLPPDVRDMSTAFLLTCISQKGDCLHLYVSET